MPEWLAILLARVRIPAVLILVALALLSWFSRVHVLPGGWIGTSVFFGGYVVLMRAGTLRRDPVVVRPPVSGRWRVLNRPTSRVPSHGIQAYGQTYAIDLVCDPPSGARPGFGWRPAARRPEDYPGFGRPVLAPAEGTVVRVHSRERDHWSRTSPAGLLYLLTVELLRELFGPSRVVGNHVVLDLGDGVFALLAHLRRRSIKVAPGRRVAAGDLIAECGNSGNSTEPHVHFQLMDRPNALIAAGLPVSFATPGGDPCPVPGNGCFLEVPDPDASSLAERVEGQDPREVSGFAGASQDPHAFSA